METSLNRPDKRFNADRFQASTNSHFNPRALPSQIIGRASIISGDVRRYCRSVAQLTPPAVHVTSAHHRAPSCGPTRSARSARPYWAFRRFRPARAFGSPDRDGFALCGNPQAIRGNVVQPSKIEVRAKQRSLKTGRGMKSEIQGWDHRLNRRIVYAALYRICSCVQPCSI